MLLFEWRAVRRSVASGCRRRRLEVCGKGRRGTPKRRPPNDDDAASPANKKKHTHISYYFGGYWFLFYVSDSAFHHFEAFVCKAFFFFFCFRSQELFFCCWFSCCCNGLCVCVCVREPEHWADTGTERWSRWRWWWRSRKIYIRFLGSSFWCRLEREEVDARADFSLLLLWMNIAAEKWVSWLARAETLWMNELATKDSLRHAKILPSRSRSPMPQYLAAKEWCSVERWPVTYLSCSRCACVRWHSSSSSLFLFRFFGEEMCRKKKLHGLRSLSSRIDYIRNEWVSPRRQKKRKSKTAQLNVKNPKNASRQYFCIFFVVVVVSLHIFFSASCAALVMVLGCRLSPAVTRHLAVRPK